MLYSIRNKGRIPYKPKDAKKKINKDDLTDCTSLTFKLLEEMGDYVNYLHNRANRLEELADGLVYHIREGNITDTDVIMAARSWYVNYPDAPAHEIIRELVKRDK